MFSDDFHKREKSLKYLNILVLIFSSYVLVSLTVDAFATLPTEVSKLIMLIDDSICVFFFIDFCVLFYYADNKLKFLRWGWIDLIASIPSVPFLIMGRWHRFLRILRVIRAFRAIKNLSVYVFYHRTKGIMISVAAVAFLVTIFCSISILFLENAPNCNIKTAEDALWWTFSTFNSNDTPNLFPITIEGKIVGTFLVVIGKAFYVVLIAFIASWFVHEDKLIFKTEDLKSEHILEKVLVEIQTNKE